VRIKEAGLVIKRRNFMKIKLAMCEKHAIIHLIHLIASISTSFNVISIRKCLIIYNVLKNRSILECMSLRHSYGTRFMRKKSKLEIRPRARGTEVHFPEHTERTDH